MSPPIILLHSAIPRVSHIKLIGSEDTPSRMMHSDVIMTGVILRLVHKSDFDLLKLDVTVVVQIYIALPERPFQGTA